MNNKKKLKIGVLIYTYNRTDDAKINMEIIRSVWKKSKYLKNVKIVHSFNGEKKWYSKKYLEDDLVVMKNSWHFQGASDLIDIGIQTFQKKYKNIDYVIVLASDTWLIKSVYVEGILNKMKKDDLYLATCPWGLPKRNDIRDVGMAVDFFIIDLKWATKYKMFPINYFDFHRKYGELISYQRGGNVMLEKLAYARYLKALNMEENFGGVARKQAIRKLLDLKDRVPIHTHIDKQGFWERTMYWPKIGLLSHHDPVPKKEILKKNNIKDGGNIKKLLKSKNFLYFNSGITKMKYNCN